MNQNTMYILREDVRELHLEISNLCNAACPMCVRNSFGGRTKNNPGWGSWQPGDEKIVFDKQALPGLRDVFFCGTHGDPSMAPTFLETVKHCKQIGLNVNMFTNGGARTSDWWRELSGMLTANDKIVFGIDGIETNHLYRQKTKIENVLEHLQICADSKAKTQWDFLVFRHNEHEVERCKDVAQRMSVDHFNLRLTARFEKDFYPVKNEKGEVVRHLEIPKNPDYIHPNLKKMQEINKKEKKIDYKINCLYRKLRKLYVSSRLDVFPCCYISDEFENMRLNRVTEEIQVPLHQMNLRKSSWADILSTPFYSKEFVESFSGDNTHRRCINVCGVVNREVNQNKAVF